jgi:C-terminal processing protease CtpA/Prc
VVGIGATAVKPAGRPITLIRILPGTPAEKAKLQPGDQILAIDGENILKLNLARALDKLRGAPGSVVKLQLRRNTVQLYRVCALLCNGCIDRLLLGFRTGGKQRNQGDTYKE